MYVAPRSHTLLRLPELIAQGREVDVLDVDVLRLICKVDDGVVVVVEDSDRVAGPAVVRIRGLRSACDSENECPNEHVAYVRA